DDYMDYYNNHRGQWNLKQLTPVQYRNQLLVA
ncbi:MAG: IS3 family transposase, partial [Paraclostridium sp.]